MRAEDKPRMAELLRRALQREGYVVSAAHDGEQALTMGMLGGADLLVLDAMMPGRDGFDVIRQLRAAKQMTPTIMVTPRDSMSDIVLAHNAYPDDGKYTDRLDRAIAAGAPFVVEEDLVWVEGRSLLIHNAKLAVPSSDARNVLLPKGATHCRKGP